MDDFKKLTYRTLQVCIDMIDIRNHNDYAKQAALQGVKLDFKNVKRKFKELSDEQKMMMAQATAKRAQENILERSKKARLKNVK